MIDLINISLQFGGKFLFREVNFKISSGDRISLVGANGTGKSSILKIIAGQLQPESGKSRNRKESLSVTFRRNKLSMKGKVYLKKPPQPLTI